MNHADHVNLLCKGIPGRGGVWADLGAGRGAFTMALADLIGPTGEIYAVDRDARSLRQLAVAMQRSASTVKLHCVEGDLRNRLALPPLDGIVMANSLHFVDDKGLVLDLVRSYLQPAGRLLLVEYNTDRGNHWVPYPLSYMSWQSLALKHGFTHTELLTTRPSSFLGEFFAAASW